tara:strand:- start:9563 stop:9856 length:294 start_codon:yes stop_codon:yes gene_type:complete
MASVKKRKAYRVKLEADRRAAAAAATAAAVEEAEVDVVEEAIAAKTKAKAAKTKAKAPKEKKAASVILTEDAAPTRTTKRKRSGRFFGRKSADSDGE